MFLRLDAVATAVPVLAVSMGVLAQEATLPSDALRLLNGRADYGRYEAQVLEVIDADTLKLNVYLWPGHELTINVRSRGVDSPEMRRPDCPEEESAAVDAAASIERKFPVGTWVYLDNVEPDKYGERVLSDIDRWISDRFQTVTEELLDQDGRWGVAWDGTGEGHNWCPDMAAE